MISVSAVDDGIRGKDYVAVKDGNITIQVGDEGLKSDNEEDATRGYASIEDGVLIITTLSTAHHPGGWACSPSRRDGGSRNGFSAGRRAAQIHPLPDAGLSGSGER